MDNENIAITKKWVDYKGKSVLEFYPYDEVEIIAEIFEDDGWCYRSPALDTHYEYLGSDSLENAKEEVEDLIIDYYEEAIQDLEYVLDLFKL